ncbi:MAG TPA: ATP-dependent Clp protease proteolytic subunit [Aggregatilineales bacterium]|nr:ATP-dependent Clp protease proteolytic subunit [Anaerolineales bacterium]HRE48251.1 ATP-dependent Clp protease proteolytic subunit [Aggregatilineales bacterium]
MFIPTVVEDTGRYERAWDVYSLLLKERIVFLGSEINSIVANSIVAQLLYLEHEDPEREIRMYIQSPGGEIYAGMAILDTMRAIRAPVSTTAIGMTASFGTVLLAAGRKGLRYALPNATIHMHQPLSYGGGGGQASDIAIQAKEIIRLKESLLNFFVETTGQLRAKLEQDTDRDIYMTAQQALEYGLIDSVLNKPA